MTRLPRAALIAVVLAAGVVPVVSQSQKPARPPPRDGRGTAHVAGMVNELNGTPVAGATVTLTSAASKKATTTSTATTTSMTLIATSDVLTIMQSRFRKG